MGGVFFYNRNQFGGMLMSQVTTCFWCAFSPEENERALDVLSEVRISFSRILISGVPIIFPEEQSKRVVLGYGCDENIATIHYLVKDDRIAFLSVVMATRLVVPDHLKKLFIHHQFASGLPVLPAEFDCFKYASGWRDLVSCDADSDLVRAGINPFPRAKPITGAIATR
jgi:hypothetical protein